jgi:hypothetical protein
MSLLINDAVVTKKNLGRTDPFCKAQLRKFFNSHDWNTHHLWRAKQVNEWEHSFPEIWRESFEVCLYCVSM